MAKIWDIK